MRMTNGLARIAMLASIATWALAFQACDSNNADEDTTTDTAVDSNDLVGDTSDAESDPDTIPDPTTEPPVDTHEVTPDTPADVPTEPGDGAVGDACTEAADCGTAMPNCLTDIMGYVTLPGGYCSGDCTSDADCGDGATCLDLYIMQICVKNCTDSSDCREAEGYSCEEMPIVGGGPFCLPPYELPDMPTDAPMDVPTDVFPDTGADIPTE